jgi:cell division protein FtsB
MMMPPPIQKPRYYGLFISSLLLKAIIVITVLMMLGGLGYLTAEAATLAETSFEWRWWLPRVATLVLGGGGFVFFCFILAQLIDVQLSVNERLNQLAERLNTLGATSSSLAEAAKNLELTQKQVTEVVDRQNRLLRLRGEEVSDVPPRLLKK